MTPHASGTAGRATVIALVLLLVLLLALGGGLGWWLTRSRAPEPVSPALPASNASAASESSDTPASPTPPKPTAASSAPAPAETPVASAREPGPAFVEESGCALCHPEQVAAWTGSNHDLAMQEATPATVLGDFADARFQDQSTDTLFTHGAQGFEVETEGPDGARARFPVPYVFGLEPLQQVLVELPRGHLQALSVAWDVRAKRWYSLYPDERIDHADSLHWTRAPMNWNFSCAECHATDLKRNYDAERDAYATTWSRIDVGCQACHGPAERHVQWALGEGEESEGDDASAQRGFDRPLTVADSSVEVEACARCHARRAPIDDGFDHRNRLLDDYLPALLTEGLYHADGQQLDEVYEYGSFVQSKMHAHGVRCSDCHDPHSQRLRMEGNTLCASCHSPTPKARAHVDLSSLVRKNYDTPEHHHHAPGTPGSKCVDCHMPARDYMIVDPRRDHGFRVPRPDLADATGAPDLCTGCHAERDAAWAAKRVVEWFGSKPRPATFGVALQAGRSGRAGAADALLALAASKETAIVRATGLVELTRYPSERALAAFLAGAADADGLVRLASISGLELFPPQQSLGALGALLADPLRGVRIEAARALNGTPAEALGPFAAPLRTAVVELEAVQNHLLERPEARLNLAQIALARGDRAAAEAELRGALRLDELYVPAYVNLADLTRVTKNEREAEGVLRDGLALVPTAPTLHHALGLSLVRQGRSEEGLAALAHAAELAPTDDRLGFVHAVALHDLGHPDEARAELERLLAARPEARDARFALAGYRREAGDEEGATRCLEELAAINPYDPGLAGAVAPGGPGR